MKYTVTLLFLFLSFYVASAQVYIGEPAPEISLPDVNGQEMKLSSLKGKVVLVDFWASWCPPCRLANPGVVKMYQKYKEKGFEVFGVSLDSKKSAWIRAIKKDKITYPQVMDEEGWRSRIAYQYGVQAIPTTFLLDRNGNVVAIDLEGKQLAKAVEALLEKY